MDWITSIKEIRKAQENNQLVIFVGAGVSKNSDVPTWWELIKKFADELSYSKCLTCDAKKINCMNEDCKKRFDFTQEEFLRIPEYYYQQCKGEEDKYYNLIYETLSGGTGPNLIDDEIINLLPHHIITTNYDSLLEDSIVINSNIYTVVAEDSDLLARASDHYIIKMHGDLEKPKSIVLKESDYIDYEQKHPLISTFIKSLLVNHTFIFLGYSLNDYNLNLIIGWINYFKKFHGIKERPNNFLISSNEASLFEKTRLEDRNINVINIEEIPEKVVVKANIPEEFDKPVGRKLLTYLKCISNDRLINEYVSLEEHLNEKYNLLQSYEKISYQDLIGVHPLGRTKILDTELVFFERTWFDKISEIIKNSNSLVVKTFCKAGVSAIHLFEDDTQIVVPGAYEEIDNIYALYFENDYIKIEEELETCIDPVKKLYFYHLLGRSQNQLKLLTNEIEKQLKVNDYVSIMLHKMRTRMALMTLSDNQSERMYELENLFGTTMPKFKTCMSFLRMLFESTSRNLYKMEKLLEKHEKRYEYNSNTIYFDNAFINLWELKAYAYDYYYFGMENGLPLHYFSDSKEYLSYYIKSVLCTYSPTKQSLDVVNMPIARTVKRYKLSEVELDMIVKYVNSKDLQNWMKKYHVQTIEIDEDLDVLVSFANLCNSFAKFKIRYWQDYITNFVVVLCLLKLDDSQKKYIYTTLINTLKILASEEPQATEALMDAVDYMVHHMDLDNSVEEYVQLLDILVNKNVYAILVEMASSKLQDVLKKIGKHATKQIQNTIIADISKIEESKEICQKTYVLRHLLKKEVKQNIFNKYSNELTIRQIFYLIVDGTLDFSEELYMRFVKIICDEDESRKKNPGMGTMPDWLLVSLELLLLLKLLKFPIDLYILKPYKDYSDHLQFMLDPLVFDYTKVDINHYMWQNLIYSDEYRHYFVENKRMILTKRLQEVFELGVETVEQRKIVYGILLNDDEIRGY